MTVMYTIFKRCIELEADGAEKNGKSKFPSRYNSKQYKIRTDRNWLLNSNVNRV